MLSIENIRQIIGRIMSQLERNHERLRYWKRVESKILVEVNKTERRTRNGGVEGASPCEKYKSVRRVIDHFETYADYKESLLKVELRLLEMMSDLQE